MQKFKRIPKHSGVIPDGNRRWAVARGMDKSEGYDHGVWPGFELYELCVDLGIQELTLYGFTVDNTKRPAVQKKAFQKACVDAVKELANRDAELLVVGNTESPSFPAELRPYTRRVKFGAGKIKVNFLVNYGWDWDLKQKDGLASKDISRIDLIIRNNVRQQASSLSRTDKDGRGTSLIHKYLNAGVVQGGLFEKTEVGVPQGGPLSPILSNIMLNELDKELTRRSHRFVRYADDCMIFCKSRKSEERTLKNIVPFIESKLFLVWEVGR